ncbi:MAG: helix-turn-helix transcriptional regulator [Gammaproteobacteria bacterium]|nr:helix-turn-helix transcriptional regulator [Gammaproteobacteria bacterium]
MHSDPKTFGRAISNARKEKNWTLKDLVAHIQKEDGCPISPQYLNDIEHDRRHPSSDRMVKQFAQALDLDAEWLAYLAGRFLQNSRGKKLSEKDFTAGMVAFRRTSSKERSR